MWKRYEEANRANAKSFTVVFALDRFSRKNTSLRSFGCLLALVGPAPDDR